MVIPSADSQPGSVQPRTPRSDSSPDGVTLPRLNAEEFRRKLAGLTDPDYREQTVSEREAVKQDAFRFASLLAHLFGPSLDRLSMWEKIGSALASATAKVSDDDLDRFVTLCLEHVQAEDSQVAACDALLSLLEAWQLRPKEWRLSLLNYLATHRSAVLIRGRRRWEQVKSKEVEL